MYFFSHTRLINISFLPRILSLQSVCNIYPGRHFIMIIQAVVVIIRCEYNSSQGQTDSRGSQKNLDRNNKSQQWAGPFYKINSNKIKMIFAPSFPTCYLMLLPPPALIWNYVRGGPPCPFWFPSGFFWDTLYSYELPKGEAFFITQQLENIQWEVEFPAQQESFW